MATTVIHCKRGDGLIKMNRRRLEMMTQVHTLQEPVLLLGKEWFAGMDISVHMKGGGHMAQIYPMHQSISKALGAYYQKYVDEASKQIKKFFIQYGCTLLVADSHRYESKKFGGHGVYPHYQELYQ